MITSLTFRKVLVGVTASLLLSSVPALTQSKQKTQKTQKPTAPLQRPVLWHDPGAVESLDFTNGPGGAKNLPQPPFTFVEEDKGGTNPKIKITDASGKSWGVKWGSEVSGEVFSSRMVWAVGYHVEPSYFVPSGKIVGAKSLSRAKKYVQSDGSFKDARFELKEKGIDKATDKQSWRWDKNPFVGTRELNGLKIMVMLLSNWDPKDQTDSQSNTAIYTKRNTGEVTYVMSDWGATMGKWGGVMSREKWDCDGFASQTKKFVTGSSGGTVKFGYEGKRASEMTTSIRVSDVQWLLGYIGRISDEQLRAGLQASGATPQEVACYTTALRDRINQLKSAAR
jgi:hypothetical protein